MTDEPDKKQEISIARFRREYLAADELARTVANFRQEVAIPAHNELRYAGHHFLQSIGDNGELNDDDQLRRAITHCQRAAYEAADAGILSALDMIEIFKTDYKRVTIADLLPNYGEIIRRAREAKNFLSRARKHSDDVPIISAEILETFNKLKEDCEVLEDHRDELNKKIGQDLAGHRRFVVGIAVAIILAIVGGTVTIATTYINSEGKSAATDE